MRPSRRSILGWLSGALAAAVKPAFARLFMPSAAVNATSPQTPLAVNYSPAGPLTVFDNITTSTIISTVSVSTSDGLAFGGTTSLLVNAGGRVVLSGNEVVPAHNFTGADDGTNLTISVQASENSVNVSGNLTLNVVPPGMVTTIQGTTYPFDGDTEWAATPGTPLQAVGTITLQLTNSWIYGFNGTSNSATLTGQWYVDENPVGPQVSATGVFTSGAPPLPITWDTTTVPDGTHMVWMKFTDQTADQAYSYRCFGSPIVVHNMGFSTGPQTVPATAGDHIRRVLYSNRPDYVHYPGGGGTPQNTAVPLTANNAFVPPQAGVMAPTPANATGPYFQQSITNPTTSEYASDPVWATLSPLQTGSGVEGGVYILPVSVEDGGGVTGTSSSDSTYFVNLALNPSDGGRNVNLVSSIINLMPEPNDAAWYGVELQGRLFRADYDGTITTIAGFTKDYSKLAFGPVKGGNPSTEDMYRTRQILVGNFTGGAEDLGTAIDLCFDPRNADIIYVCLQGDCIIHKVDKSGFPAIPATITPYAGTGEPGYLDSATATLAQFDHPNSIIMTDGVHGPDPAGVMYVADTNNCVIRKIASPSAGVAGAVTTFLGYQPARPSRPTFEGSPNTYSPNSGNLPFSSFAGPSPTSFIPYPFTIRFTSTGDILILQNENVQVRRVNFASSTVTHIGYFEGQNQVVVGDAWAWMAVDAQGAFGPVDQIYLAQSLTIEGGAENYATLPIGGGTTGFIGAIGGAFGIQGEMHQSGDTTWFYHGWGHYPWAVAVGNTQGRAIFAGVSDRGLHEVRPYQPNDPRIGPGTSPGANLSTDVMISGYSIWYTGTVSGRGAGTNGMPNGLHPVPPGYPRPFPFNIRPSFQAIHGDTGNGLLGNQGRFAGASSFDEMIITYPTDAALAAFIQSGMAGSTPRPEISGNDMRDLIYFIRINTVAGSANGLNNVVPGPDDPDTGNFPTITSMTATRMSPTAINVVWSTSKPCIGFAAAGSASQQGQTVQYPVFSDIETAGVSVAPLTYPTSHSVTIHDCPANQSMYVIAVAKDMAGNSVHSSQVFVP